MAKYNLELFFYPDRKQLTGVCQIIFSNQSSRTLEKIYLRLDLNRSQDNQFLERFDQDSRWMRN
ncbi:hypothetical protein BBF96_03925 [Anoxybacter fermentans]|uniref:Uncharacterized protein n=1 Tax=Anoxybacter fermentans TaxID=1323375 RepID=A0A3S9SWF9_9FIRM|nr:hypothetical protein [Anoxybacter fermentans]AZR72608.1 hypothetical protein BBF96_03925 [Anoxybacter fermentans]